MLYYSSFIRIGSPILILLLLLTSCESNGQKSFRNSSDLKKGSVIDSGFCTVMRMIGEDCKMPENSSLYMWLSYTPPAWVDTSIVISIKEIDKKNVMKLTFLNPNNPTALDDPRIFGHSLPNEFISQVQVLPDSVKEKVMNEVVKIKYWDLPTNDQSDPFMDGITIYFAVYNKGRNHIVKRHIRGYEKIDISSVINILFKINNVVIN